jgi:ribosomal protein S1
LHDRYSQILTRTLSAEIDFIIIGIDRRGNSVVASRKAAMVRKQQNFYLPGARRRTPLIQEGMTVEARVIGVGDSVIRVEVFGVEASISAREVAWEWVDDCNDYFQIGERVLVKIMGITLASAGNIHIRASIRETVDNPARENIKKCVAQGKYIGKVTGMDDRAIYVRLNVGVNAIATSVQDRKFPSRKDDVSFVVTHIEQDAGYVVGIITRVIKQYL